MIWPTLGSNHIKEVPAEIFRNATDMQQLYLFDNQIDVIPSEIGLLVKCEKMSLSRNNLRELPASITEISGLKELYLSSNPKFSKLPDSIGKFRMLQELSIRDNKSLKTLPPSLANGCLELKVIDGQFYRAKGKPQCKVSADILAKLEERDCKVLGIKAGKAKKGKKK